MKWNRIMIKKMTCREKWPANTPLKSKCDCWIASRCEKKIMLIKPGINHNSICVNSISVLSTESSRLEKKSKKRMNTRLIKALIISDEEATAVFSVVLLVMLTKRIWAFFIRPLFVVSKMEVTIRNKAHTPIWVCVKDRIRIMKLIRPKKVSEKRCRKV